MRILVNENKDNKNIQLKEMSHENAIFSEQEHFPLLSPGGAASGKKGWAEHEGCSDPPAHPGPVGPGGVGLAGKPHHHPTFYVYIDTNMCVCVYTYSL